MMISTERANGILAHLKEAQENKDWAQISEILDEASENDFTVLESIVPDLAEHPKWLIRASTIERIGDLHLRRLTDLVHNRLKDKHPVVRAFALMAYYDLLGTQALPAIKDVCSSENVGLRFTALALHYAETGDEETLDQFSRILAAKQRHPENDGTTVSLFDRYYEV